MAVQVARCDELHATLTSTFIWLPAGSSKGRVAADFMLNLIAYNLIRIPKLIVVKPKVCGIRQGIKSAIPPDTWQRRL